MIDRYDPYRTSSREYFMLKNSQVSVLQDWVTKLPLRAQGTLLTCVRGCDLVPKYPLDSTERKLVGMLRCAFMVPADPREVDIEPGCFFITPRQEFLNFKPSELGHYPQHWYSHIMHASEVIAYCHPDEHIAGIFLALYNKLVINLHLYPEDYASFNERILEDRIMTGKVVS